MSGMKIAKAQDDRMSESRRKLRDAMFFALGSYMEQEPKKGDQWRDQTYGAIYAHAKHEFAEIARSRGKTVRLHNAVDACTLLAMLIVKIMEEEEENGTWVLL